MDIKIKYPTDVLECESITVTSEITNNSIFYNPKEGYVRFFKDDSKRGYFLEMFQNNKNFKKPAVRHEVK